MTDRPEQGPRQRSIARYLSWLRNDLLHRALRFTVTAILPVSIGLHRGIEPWLVFATLGAIIAFVGDEQGAASHADLRHVNFDPGRRTRRE